MDLTTLQDLKARVDAASGPDRELDSAIWLALTPGATRKATPVKSAKGLWPDYVIDETRDATGQLIIVPSYSASIDAAVSLTERVLPGWDILVFREGGSWGSECGPTGTFDSFSSMANVSPSLAILSATLAALIAQEQG